MLPFCCARITNFYAFPCVGRIFNIKINGCSCETYRCTIIAFPEESMVIISFACRINPSLNSERFSWAKAIIQLCLIAILIKQILLSLKADITCISSDCTAANAAWNSRIKLQIYFISVFTLITHQYFFFRGFKRFIRFVQLGQPFICYIFFKTIVDMQS